MVKKNHIKIGIFAYSLMAIGAISVNSAMSVMAEHFGVSDTTISALASIPCIVTIVITLFLGKVLTKISQKKVGIFGACLFLIGGLLPMVLDNLYLIFICRGITGIGIAISQVFMATLTAEFFEEGERPPVQGLAQASQSLGMAVMCMLSGILAAISWQMSFLVHLIGIFSLFGMIFFIPEKKPQAKEADAPKEKIRMTKNTVGWFVLMFVVFLVLLVLANNLSFLLLEKNIGTSENAGIALGIYAVAGLLVGLAYGKIDKYIKAKKIPLAMFLFAIGFFCAIIAKSIFVVYLGSFIAGAALSLFFPQIMLYTGMSVKPIAIPMAVSLLTCFQNLGQILCPYVINNLIGLFTPTEHLQLYKYIFACIAFVILTAITLVYAIRRDKRDKAAV